LAAVRAFSRWLAKRIGRDMLAAIEESNADTDPRHERRALDVAELQAILAATAASLHDFRGLSGADRFALAMTTGYRAAELASLFRYSFNLDGCTPVARVKAAFSKNKKESEQPLPADVADRRHAALARSIAGASIRRFLSRSRGVSGLPSVTSFDKN
jgi:hypothetical protein